MTIEELLAREEIKELRAAYSHYVDGHELDKLVELFTDDAVLEFPEAHGGAWVGKDQIRARYEAAMPVIGEPFDSMHVTTNPYIVLDGPDTARGRWYLLDLLARQMHLPTAALATPGGHNNPLMYLAMYEDQYRKISGAWRIAGFTLHVFWPARQYEALRFP
jgi:ketosteroid isomerase-like protein